MTAGVVFLAVAFVMLTGPTVAMFHNVLVGLDRR